MRILLRRNRLLGLAVGAALLAGGCSSVTESRAVSVNGETISAEEIESELMAIRGNDQYREVVEQGLARQGLGPTIAGEGQGSFDTAFVARLLTLSVYYELFGQESAARGLGVTEADLEESRPQAVASVGGDQVFAAFPVSYQDQLVGRQALTRRMQQVVAPDPTPEEIQAFYEANQADFEGVCVSHIFANPAERGPDGARARIDDLARQLAEGADFRVLASEQSDDPAAAAEAGSLGCGVRGRFIPEFEEAVFTLPVGQVSPPLETGSGFHLVLVESRGPQPLEEVQAQVAQALAQERSVDFGTFVDELTCKAEIDVNPRYGSWAAACDDPQAPGAVSPPEGPAAPIPAPGSPGGGPVAPDDPSTGR